MRMSCNGCRVLRKGCSKDCSIRPCLQWIKSSESQAHATVFLAKFYGRAGLINLLNSGPAHLRPAVFRSLLYEACGRIINPVHGSVGLLSSNSWPSCQSAVEAVLRGAPIDHIALDDDVVQPLGTCDIRHVGKVSGKKNQTRFRRCSKRVSEPDKVCKQGKCMESNGSDVSHGNGSADLDQSHVDPVQPDGEIELELTLGFGPVGHGPKPVTSESKMDMDMDLS